MISLKILGPLLTAAGSLLLAWRVKKILDSLVFAQSATEENFLSLRAFLSGASKDVKLISGLDRHVERSHRLGILLLVLGFVLIGTGALIAAYVAWQSM